MIFVTIVNCVRISRGLKEENEHNVIPFFCRLCVACHEVFVRFRLCPLSAHDEDGDIGGEAGQASGVTL